MIFNENLFAAETEMEARTTLTSWAYLALQTAWGGTFLPFSLSHHLKQKKKTSVLSCLQKGNDESCLYPMTTSGSILQHNKFNMNVNGSKLKYNIGWGT